MITITQLASNMKPIEIEKELKKYVFGQDEYIKKLSVIACKHMDNIKLVENNLEPINNNALVIGPSGCGKTYALKQLAKILDVPFIEVDGSSLQSSNYIGHMHVRSIFNDAIARYGIEKVQKSILFIDEFDKTLDVYMLNTTGAHLVQRDLLKLFENGSKFPIGDMRGESVKIDHEVYHSIDTRAISIICAGSYAEAYSAYQGNQYSSSDGKIGFDNDSASKVKPVCKKFDAVDLIQMGNLPELIGRFSTIININPLSKEDIYNIFKNGRNTSLDKQRQLLKLSNVKVDYSDAFCRKIADQIQDDNTGFRGADKIVNHIFEEVIYTVKNEPNICFVNLDVKNDEFVITFKYNDGTKPKIITLPKSNYVASSSPLNKTKAKYTRTIE